MPAEGNPTPVDPRLIKKMVAAASATIACVAAFRIFNADQAAAMTSAIAALAAIWEPTPSP